MHEATLTNHNRLLRLYPYAIGLKTGYTIKSGKCLVSAAEKDGVTLVAVTLNGGDYWNDHIALYEYGFSITESCELALPQLPALPVAGGTAAQTALTMEQPSPVVLLNSESDQVRCERRLPAFVWAPVEAGETVGTVVYTVGDRVLCEVPIQAAETVNERPAMSFVKKWQQRMELLLRELLE